MKVKSIFQKKWISILNNYNEKPFLNITEELFKQPFKHLPKQILLSEHEVNELRLLQNRVYTGLSSAEYLKKMQLTIKRGYYDKERHASLLKDLNRIEQKCKELNICLPEHFSEFFKNSDYISRIRHEDLSFLLHYPIVPFPKAKNHFLLPIFGHLEGCFWWYLLFDNLGNHCMIYNLYFWEELENESPYYICCDTFKEFLVRLSYEIRIKEGEKINW